MYLSKIILLFMCTIILHLSLESEAIRCYQCSSDTDPKGEDICGAYTQFDTVKNVAIDCLDGDSKMPGSFCVKVVQQSPIGFIWDGRWRQVIRRCASTASTGVTGVCNWGVNEVGVYWEECYCSGDSCNGATTLSSSIALSIVASVILAIYSFA